MISALLCNEQAVTEEKYSSLGLAISDKSSCLIVKEGEETVGFCLFELDQKGIEVLALEPQDDIWLADFTLRSALHIAAERCAMDARFADGAPIDILEKLGFVLDRADKTLDIDKLFKSCCGCGEE